MTTSSPPPPPPSTVAAATTSATNPAVPVFAPLFIEQLSVRNFRGIDAASVTFEPGVTLIVGRNNAGKSRLLRAVAIALRAVEADADDLTVDAGVSAEIDLVIAPAPPIALHERAAWATGEQTFDVRVARAFGGVEQISASPSRERFAWRTTIRPSREGGVRTENGILTYDLGAKEDTPARPISTRWVLRDRARPLGRDQRQLLAAHWIHERRDLADELSRRGSAIRRVLDDLEIDDVTRDNLQTMLSALGEVIVESSGSLQSVQTALELLHQAIDTIGQPSLLPLPQRLEELARTVTVGMNTGTGDLPIRVHGSGARSLASLQLQNVLYSTRTGRDGPALLPLPVSLIEEPEAHLHPQAQFELATLLGGMAGQALVSTHSAHLVTAQRPADIRILRTEGGRLHVVDLHPASSSASPRHRALKPQDYLKSMDRLKRQAERPFGEMLFASGLIVGDGATERAMLPPLLRFALGPRAAGICVVDPESMSQAGAPVSLAELIGIPWLLYADGDSAGTVHAEAVCTRFSRPTSEIVWVTREDGVRCAAEEMMLTFDATVLTAVCAQLPPGQSNQKQLRDAKALAGTLFAAALLDVRGDRARVLATGYWPAPIQELLRRVQAWLANTKGP